jgi:hypothetical protein
LNLATQKLSGIIPVSPDDSIAEHFALLPVSSGLFLGLSPTEESRGSDGTDYDILTIAPPTSTSAGGSAIFNFSGRSVLAGTAEDTAALDSTGIIYAMDEFTGNLFLADLTQATVDATTMPFTWTAPSQIQNLSELSTADVCGMAVAYGTHEALVEQEFGGALFGAVKLPATSGSGTPAATDWVAATMPNPTGSVWSNPLDPHGLTAAFADLR